MKNRINHKFQGTKKLSKNYNNSEAQLHTKLETDLRQNLNCNFIEHYLLKITKGDPTLEKVRNRIFHHPAKVATKLGISASQISMLGVFFAISAAALFPWKWGFCLALLLNLTCDGIDGVVARYQKTDSDKGAILDAICDNTSLCAVAIGLWAYGVLPPITLLFYCTITILYSQHSMRKSKILFGIYRSLGLRVFTFMGLLFITNDISGEHFAINENQFFLFLSVILMVIYFLDLFWSRKPTT